MVNFHLDDVQRCAVSTEKVSSSKMCNFDNCESGRNERGMTSEFLKEQ
jgi:hypothetical protein